MTTFPPRMSSPKAAGAEGLTRRDALRILAAGVAGTTGLPGLAGAMGRNDSTVRLSGRLSLHNIHTGESIDVQYADPHTGRLDPEAAEQLDRFFRCHYTNDVCTIDRRLYQLLDRLQQDVEAVGKTYHLVSGYRSPAYNELLRSRSRNVASKSYHLSGMAADVWMEDVPVPRLQRAALARAQGGVGYYGDFLHVDVGPIRRW